MELSCKSVKSITGFVLASTECVPTKVPVITEGEPQRAPVKVLVTTLTDKVPTELLVTAEWVPVAT